MLLQTRRAPGLLGARFFWFFMFVFDITDSTATNQSNFKPRWVAQVSLLRPGFPPQVGPDRNTHAKFVRIIFMFSGEPAKSGRLMCSALPHDRYRRRRNSLPRGGFKQGAGKLVAME
jgi:hypothetical protein